MMMTTRSSMRVKPLSSPASRFVSFSRMVLSCSFRTMKTRGARTRVTRASGSGLSSAEAYGQAPVTMSAPGPAFFQVAGPTVLWTQ